MIESALVYAGMGLFFLIGMYILIRGARASYLGGFKFYLTLGIAWGLGAWFLSGILWLVYISNILPWIVPSTCEEVRRGVASCLIPMVALLEAFVAGRWLERQKATARKTHPLEWQAWESKLKQATGLDKFLLYRGIKKTR